MKTAQQRKNRQTSQHGSSLVELMMAMLVLTIGLGAVTSLLATAIASNNRNGSDTTATLLAQMVIEQISAQHVYSDQQVSVTDCAGNSWNIATTPGTAGTGDGATVKSDGTIDFTQAYANITAGYAMKYVDCSNAGGLPITYEVRWNVMSVSTNTTLRMITSAARPLSSNVSSLGNLYFALPINLRGVGGPTTGE